MLDDIDRVYVNDRARRVLGWAPRHDFASSIACLARDAAPGSALSAIVGSKGYHRAG